jgi:hypothetical protein
MIIAPSPSEKKQSALIIIAVALCIHGGLGSLLFLLEPTYSWVKTDEAQVILIDEQKLNKPPHTTLVPEKEEWGLVLPEELLMLAGRPATTKNMPSTTTAPIDKQKPALEKQTRCNTLEEKPDSNSLAIAESLSTKKSRETDTKQKSTSLVAAEPLSSEESTQTDQKKNITAMTTTASPSPIKTVQTKEKQTAYAQTTRSTERRYGSPSSKQLTLASLGKGFLEQLPKASYGRNFMPGSQRAKLAASQIAIEEYNTRLEKMVSPIFHAIVREIPLPKNVSRPPDFRTDFSPEGKLTEITILQSSGNEYYDQQLLKKIKESNVWGPPLPESVRIAREENHLNSTFYY